MDFFETCKLGRLCDTHGVCVTRLVAQDGCTCISGMAASIFGLRMSHTNNNEFTRSRPGLTNNTFRPYPKHFRLYPVLFRLRMSHTNNHVGMAYYSTNCIQQLMELSWTQQTSYLCVQVIIFGLNNTVLDSYAIRLCAMNIIVGSKTILIKSTCASW